MRILVIALCLLAAPALAKGRDYSKMFPGVDGGATWDLMVYGKVLAPHQRFNHGHDCRCGHDGQPRETAYPYEEEE